MSVQVALLLPGPYDATSWYRGAGPWSELARAARQGGKAGIELRHLSAVGWPDLLSADILYMQRPFKKEHRAVAELAKNCGAKVWVDYDDDLFQVPADNPFHMAAQESLGEVKACLGMADVLTVSTDALRSSLCEQVRDSTRVVVVPNAWNERVLPLVVHRAKPPSEPVNVFWRGSDTHTRDLAEVKDELLALVKMHPDWRWTFMGYRPWFLDGVPNVMLLPKTDVLSYMRMLPHRPQDVVIVPLHDCGFNRAKSCIAWMEATQMGAVAVAPDFREWNKPGVVRYAQGDFFEAVQAAAGQAKERSVEAARVYIRQNLTLEAVNAQRVAILESLL